MSSLSNGSAGGQNERPGSIRENLFWQASKVTPTQREARNGHFGCVLWLTGLSASGKTTIATELEQQLFSVGKQVYVLDGDNNRHGLGKDLGFSQHDRAENIRRVGEVAKLFAQAGFICITAFISPYRSDRDLVRKLMPVGRFVEVFVNAPLEVCERRDAKGLYAKARTNNIAEFTGISAPYEEPAIPELELRTDLLSIPECVEKILGRLASMENPMEASPIAQTRQIHDLVGKANDAPAN
jgi:adenylyl-sulfate kinase